MVAKGEEDEVAAADCPYTAEEEEEVDHDPGSHSSSDHAAALEAFPCYLSAVGSFENDASAPGVP